MVKHPQSTVRYPFTRLALLLYVGLQGNPQDIPSALIGKPAPDFALSAIPGLRAGQDAGLSKQDLMTGEVIVLNVWASWCGPCRVEHPVLMKLARAGAVPIYGLNYKDEAVDAKRFLDELEDPYERIGIDQDGRVGFEWGVYGVPETFIISGDGQIIDKYVGQMDAKAVDEVILPHLQALGWSAKE